MVILAGSLLRDNETGKVLGQFKFKNITDKIIKALVIKVDAYDVSGKELPGIAEYQYLDLFVRRDGEFGQKSAVVLPESITRSIKVQCIGAVFVDDSQWAAPQDAVWSPLPAQQKISNTVGFALAQQYRRMTTDQAEYVPADCEELWLCACGGINHAEEAACHNCGYTKPELLQALDEESLTEGLNKHRADMQAIAEEEERERAKKAAEQAVLRKKIAKISAIAAIVAVIISLGLLLNKYVLIPLREYNDAIALMDAGQYDEAIIAFDAMGDYKDSAIKIDECRTAILDGKYNDALTLMEGGNYKEAIDIFKALGSYRDSLEKINEAELAQKYATAENMLAAGEYESALRIFGYLDEYSDSATRAMDAQYMLAEEYLEAGAYQEALLAFKKIPEYKDSAAKINECNAVVEAKYSSLRCALSTYTEEFDSAAMASLIEAQNNQQNSTSYTMHDGWIYGRAFDSSGKAVFVKCRSNFTERTVLDRGTAYMPQIKDGYIYYMLYCTDGDKGLFRMRLDGTGREQLSDIFGDMQICGDTIYFSNDDDNNTYAGNHLYSIALDGSDFQELIDKPIFHWFVFGDCVLYQDDRDNESLHIANFEGYDIKLNDEVSYFPIFDGNHIYYIKRIDDVHSIWRIDIDGQNDMLIHKDSEAYGFALHEDRLYFINGDDNERIYSINKDGSGLHRITDDRNCTDLQFLDNYLVYVTWTDYGRYIDTIMFCTATTGYKVFDFSELK